MDHFINLHAVLSEFFGESNTPNISELLGIYGRVCLYVHKNLNIMLYSLIFF